MINKILLYVALIAVCAGYFYYSESRIDSLNKDIAKYQIAATISNETISKLRKDALTQERLRNDLQVKLIQSEKNSDNLRALLSEHNLTLLSLEKPKLIETRINDGTIKVFNDITSITSN